MRRSNPAVVNRLLPVLILSGALLAAAMVVGISLGSSQNVFPAILNAVFKKIELDPLTETIIWRIRFPRVLLAALVGAVLSLGGLVFQALLRNPLAEPYILGISGGSAIGAILGILMGLARFPGVCLTAFIGSMATLALILIMSSGQSLVKRDALLLSGVMVNAFCSAVIMFLVSMTHDARLHNIIFWLMGDLSMSSLPQIGILAAVNIPCFVLIFALSHKMNLLIMGRETARTMGVHYTAVALTLLIATSFTVSVTVSFCGLLGFVGLVMPHLLRLVLGPDHRILVPACLLGGGAFMIICDTLARVLPRQGEMPTGVITAMIGAPVFIVLLKRSRS
ncbi:MAG: iron ABC transporter permease [Desulfobacterales bacterium]